MTNMPGYSEEMDPQRERIVQMVETSVDLARRAIENPNPEIDNFVPNFFIEGTPRALIDAFNNLTVRFFTAVLTPLKEDPDFLNEKETQQFLESGMSSFAPDLALDRENREEAIQYNRELLDNAQRLFLEFSSQTILYEGREFPLSEIIKLALPHIPRANFEARADYIEQVGKMLGTGNDTTDEQFEELYGFLLTKHFGPMTRFISVNTYPSVIDVHANVAAALANNFIILTNAGKYRK